MLTNELQRVLLLPSHEPTPRPSCVKGLC